MELSGFQAKNIMQQSKGKLGEATILHCHLTFQRKQVKFCGCKYSMAVLNVSDFNYFQWVMMTWSYKANNLNLVEFCSVPLDFQKQPFHKSPIYFCFNLQ